MRREITPFRPDRRPLSVAIVVDTSAATGRSYGLVEADALAELVARLPEGARYALWGTGDRPNKLLDFTSDRATGGRILRLANRQGGGYCMLDALALASADRKTGPGEGDRAAVVAVTSTGPEVSSRDHAVQEAEKNAKLSLAVQVGTPGPSTARVSFTDFDARARLNYTLGQLTSESGAVTRS